MADSFLGISAGEYSARMYQINRETAQVKARDARFQGRLAKKANKDAFSQLKGEQRAAIAKNGFVVDYGTGMETQLDTDFQEQMNALNIEINAERQAMGYMAEADSFGMQAGLDMMRGTNSAASSLIGGAARVADSWYRYNKGS